MTAPGSSSAVQIMRRTRRYAWSARTQWPWSRDRYISYCNSCTPVWKSTLAGGLQHLLDSGCQLLPADRTNLQGKPKACTASCTSTSSASSIRVANQAPAVVRSSRPDQVAVQAEFDITVRWKPRTKSVTR